MKENKWVGMAERRPVHNQIGGIVLKMSSDMNQRKLHAAGMNEVGKGQGSIALAEQRY